MTSSVAVTARGAAHGLERLERRVQVLEDTLVALLVCIELKSDATQVDLARLDTAMLELSDTAIWSRDDD
jgi:hypothetical protein